jgi:ABC-type branched-subunit amino acid transport system ATPase component
MSHHIDNLTIHAFRQLRDLEFGSLRRVNLLVGANNSGKTTVLEAVSVFCRPLDPLEWIGAARRREIKSSREPLIDAVQWLFPQNENTPDDPYYSGECVIEGTGEFPNRRTEARFQGIVGDDETDESKSPDQPEDELESETGSASASSRRGAEIHLKCTFDLGEFFAGQTEEAEYRFQLWEDRRFVSRSPTQQPLLPVSTLSPVSHRVELLQVKGLTVATLSNTKFSVIEAVQLIDPEIESMEILSRHGIGPTLWIRHRRTGYSPVSTLGDGVRRVLTMALNLVHSSQGVLLIDEIETAIHKDALARIFTWLVSAAEHYGVQLFATTHSLEAVDALLTAQIGDQAEVLAFHLPDRGEGTIKRFEGDILDNLRFERGLDIR